MAHNILFIESGTGWGGSSAYLYSFLKYLNREKFIPVVFLYRNGEGPFVKDIRALGINVYFFKKQIVYKNCEANFIRKTNWLEKIKKILEKIKLKGILKLLLRTLQLICSDIPTIIQIKRIINQEKIKLIFLNNDLHYHIPGVLAAKLAHLPCICRKAGIGGGVRIKKILSRYVDFFIASSRGALRDYYKEGLPANKVILLYEGIDLCKFNPLLSNTTIRQQLNIPDNVVLVGSIARISSGKGQFELLDAVPCVVKKCPQVRFIIVGDDVESGGELLKQLKLKAESMGLSQYLNFTGWRDDIPELLAAIDIFVHNPNNCLETLGIATLEAMAMGKPTIVTDNWGLAETTENGITGYVVPRFESKVLSQAIINIASDPEGRYLMGKSAKKKAETLFDIRKNVKLIEEVIQKSNLNNCQSKAKG